MIQVNFCNARDWECSLRVILKFTASSGWACRGLWIDSKILVYGSLLAEAHNWNRVLQSIQPWIQAKFDFYPASCLLIPSLRTPPALVNHLTVGFSAWIFGLVLVVDPIHHGFFRRGVGRVGWGGLWVGGGGGVVYGWACRGRWVVWFVGFLCGRRTFWWCLIKPTSSSGLQQHPSGAGLWVPLRRGPASCRNSRELLLLCSLDDTKLLTDLFNTTANITESQDVLGQMMAVDHHS